ncbi:DUF6252 family protein [Saccharicrinis sp. FJH54]|uniref:DUF6252 family protein n=1 Tax=Saccharicrinis sp. FJH54 TaxID=3344665 RepID=UPI0035D52A01
MNLTFSLKKAPNVTFRFLFLVATVAFVSACTKTDPANIDSGNCKSRTGNLMTADVNGVHICTDIGAALLFKDDDNRLNMNGLFSESNPAASIDLEVLNAQKGTVDLSQAQYSTDDESEYYIVDSESGEGSGQLQISALTETEVKGSFEFTAIGINSNTDEPNGDVVKVENGTFEFQYYTN